MVINLVFLITLLLNYVFIYLFWKLFFKNDFISFIGAVVFSFSPFYHLQQGHFQMISYWPFFASLFFFLRDKNINVKNLIFSGVFIIIQFLASVYLSVFLLFSLSLYVFINSIKNKKLDDIKKFLIVFFVFLLGAGYFINGYINVKKHYNFVRNYGEYVTYSAHLTDYIFTTGIDSVFNKTLFAKKWNSFNKHAIGESAAFPGFIISLVFAFSVLIILKRKNSLVVGFKIKSEDLFFLALVILGLLFSFGPRLNFNGVYSEIPTPYTFIVKYIPFFDSIRGLARWSFLFYLGLTYYFAKFLLSKKNFIVIVVFALCLMECLPTSYITTKEDYIDIYTDEILKNECFVKQDSILLEIPTNHLMVGKGIYVGLNYISKRQLATTYHGCALVNGYSGFEPVSQTEYYNIIEKSLEDVDVSTFLKKVKERKVNFIRISPDLFVNEKRESYLATFDGLVKSKEIKKLSNFLYKVEY